MALHEKNTVRDELDDDIYASHDLSDALPKYRFPTKERNPRHIYSLVHDELMLDGNSRQNLATFCQTWVEPEVHQLMNEVKTRNAGTTSASGDPSCTACPKGKFSTGGTACRNCTASASYKTFGM